MSGRKLNRPWKQALMPVPSLRQVFDKLGEKPGPSLRQAFEIDLTPREPPPLPTKRVAAR